MHLPDLHNIYKNTLNGMVIQVIGMIQGGNNEC